MLMDNIREGVQKPWAKALILVIVVSFVGAGYFTSTLFSGDPYAAAVVNGDSISTQDFQRAYARTKQKYGDAYKQFIKSDEQERNFRENVLQELIIAKVANQAAERLGIRVSPSTIRKTIQEIPDAQVEGVYSVERLDQLLTGNGLSRASFKQSVVSSLVVSQFSKGVALTEFVLPIESSNDFKVLGQTRTGRALNFKYSLFDAGLDISDEEINRYYQENQELFRVAEKVSVEYIELSIDELAKGLSPTDEEIAEYYKENLDRFQSDDKRRVSHILIALNDDEDAALAKAKAIKQKIDAGEDFVSLVKSSSDDGFSAEQDGDLGVVAAGDMEESFEMAMNQLVAIGDVSEPVKTSFGYHLIKLTELVAGETQQLEQVKPQIIIALQSLAAEEAFYAMSKTLEEKSFEISDSLSEVSEMIGVAIKTSPVFSSSSATGIFANPEVKSAAFSENVLEGNMNSSLINIDDTHVVVLRLKSHQASEIQPLEKIKERVVANLKASKSKDMAIDFGNQIKTKILSKESVDTLLQAKGIIWKDLDKINRKSAVLPYLQLQHFFKLPRPTNEKIVVDTMQDSSEIVVFVLNAVEEGDISKAEKSLVTQAEQRLTRFFGEADYGSLVEQQRSQADITRNLDNINR
jgi:peptidyl-prolyl cis-trans isomerase D